MTLTKVYYNIQKHGWIVVDYEDLGRDCHRVIFTSNAYLPNYEYHNYSITYNIKDFIVSDNGDAHEWDKMSSTHKSSIPQ